MHEGGIRHVGVNLLDDKPFGSVSLVLVRPLRLHLALPLALTAQVVEVAPANVGHDAVDGFGDAILPCSRSRHEHVHERCLVLHVVDIPEARLPEVCPKCGEYGMRHGRFVKRGRFANEQADKWRQCAGHWGRLVVHIFSILCLLLLLLAKV